MRPTTWRLLLAIALVSGVVSWAVLFVWTGRYGALPDVPWPSAVVLGVFGGAVLVAALALRPRLRRKEGHPPVPPLVSARFAVLSLACSRAGALFVGIYGGFLAIAVSDLDIDYRRHVALVSGACVLAAALLIVAGLVLERELRLPPTEEDAQPKSTGT